MQSLFFITLLLTMFVLLWLTERFTFEQLGVSSIAAVIFVLVVNLISISRRRK